MVTVCWWVHSDDGWPWWTWKCEVFHNTTKCLLRSFYLQRPKYSCFSFLSFFPLLYPVCLSSPFTSFMPAALPFLNVPPLPSFPSIYVTFPLFSTVFIPLLRYPSSFSLSFVSLHFPLSPFLPLPFPGAILQREVVFLHSEYTSFNLVPLNARQNHVQGFRWLSNCLLTTVKCQLQQ